MVNRLRVVADIEDLLQLPVAARDLTQTALQFTGSLVGDGPTVDCVRRLLPWLEIWTDHPKWATGVWRCEVTGRTNAYSTGELLDPLALHTDMTRYVDPPAYTIVRCLREDSGGGGTNRLLHVQDILDRLRQTGNDRMLEFLHKPRTLNARGGPVPDVPLIAPDWRASPARIFDARVATEGLHVLLSPAETGMLDEFSALCESWTDLITEVDLEKFATLAFSNHCWLHGRSRCVSTHRITEVCLGNVAAARVAA